MNNDPDARLVEAERRGQHSLRNEPRARAVRYDRRTGRVHVELTNGCTFAFPARDAQGLARASDAQLAQVKILGLGLGLHWEALDVDLSVPGLLAGLFGTKAYMDRQRAAAPAPHARPPRLPPLAATAPRAVGRVNPLRRARLNGA